MTAAGRNATSSSTSNPSAAATSNAATTPRRSEWFRLRRPRLQCRHILASGTRCGSPALRDEAFCYYHHSTRKPIPRCEIADRKAHQASFDLPSPEDGLSVQVGIGEVLRRIAANEIDRRRAGLLLYGLQIASSNLHRRNQQQAQQQAAHPATCEDARITEELVEEIVHDPIHGDLAPEAELPRPEDIADRTPQQIQHDKAIRQDERERFDAQLFTVSLKLRAEIQTQLREEEATRRRAIRLARQHAELMARIRGNRQLLLHDGSNAGLPNHASAEAQDQKPADAPDRVPHLHDSLIVAQAGLRGEGHEPLSASQPSSPILTHPTSPSGIERPMLESARESEPEAACETGEAAPAPYAS